MEPARWGMVRLGGAGLGPVGQGKDRASDAMRALPANTTRFGARNRRLVSAVIGPGQAWLGWVGQGWAE